MARFALPEGQQSVFLLAGAEVDVLDGVGVDGQGLGWACEGLWAGGALGLEGFEAEGVRQGIVREVEG